MSAAEWGTSLHPAHCANCLAEFLVPGGAGAPICPNCLAARLEPIPGLEHSAPPELILPFAVGDSTLNANLVRWQRDIPFKDTSLALDALRKRMTRVYVPMYLADVSVRGSWSGQMGFDYLVASSEERYNSGQWVSQRVNETRIRWEPRAGDISRKFENVPTPALENHAALMAALGEGGTFPFDTSRAVPFAEDTLGDALVRGAEIEYAAAWQIAVPEIERRAATDCCTASGAQHREQYVLRAAYSEPNWTLMLLPVLVSGYNDDENRWLPVRINGQTGFVSGPKRSSMKRAQSWALGLAAVALLAFVLTVLLALAGAWARPMFTLAGLLLFVTLLLSLAAPVPLIVAWQYNRTNAGKKGTML